jgi:purine nucleosidase
VPRAFLIDTDTASDDAVALIMALRAPDVRVVAITTVAGNVPVLQSARNALYTVELRSCAPIEMRLGSMAAMVSEITTIPRLVNLPRARMR